MKVNFTYYIHDLNEGSDIARDIMAELDAQNVQHGMDEDELAELVGRPFYEVKLDCELDLTTGDVKILSATTT